MLQAYVIYVLGMIVNIAFSHFFNEVNVVINECLK